MSWLEHCYYHELGGHGPHADGLRGGRVRVLRSDTLWQLLIQPTVYSWALVTALQCFGGFIGALSLLVGAVVETIFGFVSVFSLEASTLLSS